MIRNIGAAAIFATFIPSYLVYAHILPAPLVESITAFTKSSNFLYLFIAAIIVGSILGMDRRVLVGGFLKIFVPLAAGSLVAPAAVGCAVGRRWALGLQHTLFKVVVPIMAGGVGEGAMPLSIGYAATSAPAAGRPLRRGAAVGDAGQPDRDHPGGRAQLPGQAPPRPDRRGPPAAGRGRLSSWPREPRPGRQWPTSLAAAHGAR